MSQRLSGRRAAAVVAFFSLVATLSFGRSASGDQIGDKRAQAAKVADQLQALEAKAEVAAEQYNDARLSVARLDGKVAQAAARLRRTQVTLAERRREMAGYAVSAYVRGEDATGVSVVLDSQDGNDIGQRAGYARAAMGDRADLADRLRGAEAAAQNDQTTFGRARTKAATAKAAVDAKRREAEAAVADQRKVLDDVRGELAGLVQAEQARRAAEAARRAQAEARRQAALLAAQAPPAPPSAGPTGGRPAATPTRPAASAAGTADTGASNGGNDAGSGAAPPAAPVADPPVGQGASAAIAAGRSVLGVRYTWAGASPSTGFDCSGFVMWAWAHGGKSLPHSSRAMWSASRRIPVSALQPGDLVFYGSPIHHVALYIGGGQIMHSPHTGSYVQIASLYYWDDMKGAGRV